MGPPDQPEFWVIVPNMAAGWTQDMLQSMSKGLQAAGHRSLVLTDDGSPLATQQINQAFSEKIGRGESFIVIDINLRVDLKGVPAGIAPRRFSWVGDNPIYHYARLSNIDEKMVIGVPDQQYFEVYEWLDVGGNLVFVPHAGHDPVVGTPAMAARDIDLLFAGSLGAMPGSDEWKAQTTEIPSALRDTVEEATNEMLAENAGSFQSLVKALGRAGIDWLERPIEEIAFAHQVVETRAETARRWEVLTNLQGLNLHFIGSIDAEGARHLESFTTFHDYTTFEAMLELVDRSRILINVTPKLAGGSHDRVWNGIAHGCVVATTFSTFLAEQFKDDGEMFFFPTDMKGFNEVLGARLADPERLDAMIGATRSKYEAKHTWRHRAETIADAVTARMKG